MLSVDKIEALFGSDEAIGVMMEVNFGEEVLSIKEYDEKYGHLGKGNGPDAASLMPDGTSAVCCTNYAHHIRNILGGIGHQVAVVGFANEDNPTSRCAIEGFHPEGHDFAIVNDRYLIDPWVRLVASVEDQIFYDLNDPADAAKANDIYGQRHLWLPLDGDAKNDKEGKMNSNSSSTKPEGDEFAEKLPGTRAVAQRQVNASNKFIDSVVEQFGLSREEAVRAWDYYVKNKLVKVDAVGGQYNLKDGRLWDGRAMRKAADMVPAEALAGYPNLNNDENPIGANMKNKIDLRTMPLLGAKLPVIQHPYTDYSLGDAVALAVNNARTFGRKEPVTLLEVRDYILDMQRRTDHQWLTGFEVRMYPCLLTYAALDVLDAAIDGRDIAKNSRIAGGTPDPATTSTSESTDVDMEAILEEHPEIHIDQAKDGKWNFRHDDNAAGPDAEYGRRGSFSTREEAIRAAFDEYGVEVEETSAARP